MVSILTGTPSSKQFGRSRILTRKMPLTELWMLANSNVFCSPHKVRSALCGAWKSRAGFVAQLQTPLCSARIQGCSWWRPTTRDAQVGDETTLPAGKKNREHLLESAAGGREGGRGAVGRPVAAADRARFPGRANYSRGG